MLLRRQHRPTSAPLTIAALITGLGLIGCEGAKFETDENTTATVGSDSTSSASVDDTGNPALPPNTPPPEPIFGGPPPEDTRGEIPGENSSAPAANTSEEAASEVISEDVETTAPATSSSEEPGDSTAVQEDTGSVEEVPPDEHCAAIADWDPAWSQWEEEVLQIVNEVRAVGADCGEEGTFGPAEPLAMDPILRCSSRLHSLDMFERDFFDHTNPDGLDPFQRMEEAGFSGSYMGENIAYGQQNPEEVMEAWVDSDGHCSNIMNPNYTLIGVGYYPGADSRRDGKQHFWTQNFGAPLRQGGFGGGGGGFGQ
jgi:uncharacterized protein YkwD